MQGIDNFITIVLTKDDRYFIIFLQPHDKVCIYLTDFNQIIILAVFMRDDYRYCFKAQEYEITLPTM